ncbi:MAG TPA: HNH endonuclease [Chthonomonadaceae bacterium]|nr:HNH endonuclease [Chthonomonadaceae bacterium]
MNDLYKYIGLFGNLHRNYVAKKGYAPHKPILLLATLDEIERGNVKTNLIKITPELVASFRAYWRALVLPTTWIERLVYPFRYLGRDGFWELLLDGMPQSTQALGDPTSLNQLAGMIDGAQLSPDLWQLLQDRTAIHALRSFLLQKYFRLGDPDVQPQLPANPIDYEIETLKAKAQSRFRIRRVSENKDETGYYIRHALFPKVVKSLYSEACAVCGLHVCLEDLSGLVDAAHIMPFGLFHNDDPRNGIALCKNHHWGFDAGWFALTDDYRLLISSRLQNALPYITTGTPILLPTQTDLAPAAEALAWHRINVYKP